MSDIPVAPPTQAALGTVRAGVIRHAVEENIQVDTHGVIAPFSFKPPGGVSGWQRVRISNYTPYLFQIIGIPGGGSGDPPQMIQPFQQNVWNYVASRGTITLLASEEGSPLAIPPLRFAYGAGSAEGDLLYNFVTVEWTDTPDLFFGYYPVPLTGVTITAEALRIVSPLPTIIPVGTEPVAVAVDETRERAYVANATSQTITVIDTGTNTVVTTITMSHTPTDVAVDIASGKVYVTFSDQHVVAIFQDNIHIGSVDVGDNQKRIATMQATGRKYVTLATGNKVAILSNTDVHTSDVVVGNTPVGIATDNTTNLVYVCNFGADTVTVINGATGLVVGPAIAVGNGPIDATTDSILNAIYVANSLDDTVSHIDGLTALVTATIAVGTTPVALDADIVTSMVYVACQSTNSVDVIDETSDLVVDTLSPGVGPNDAAVDGIKNRVWITLAADVVAVLQGV